MYRERASRTYSSLVYLACLVLVEVPFLVFNAITYSYVPLMFIYSHIYNIRFYH